MNITKIITTTTTATLPHNNKFSLATRRQRQRRHQHYYTDIYGIDNHKDDDLEFEIVLAMLKKLLYNVYI